MTPSTTDSTWPARWQRFSAAALRAFHSYASWLVSISWRRFIMLSVLLVVLAAITQSLPPFSWSVTETIEDTEPRPAARPAPPKPPSTRPAAPPPPQPTVEVRPPARGASKPDGIDISIDERGIRITPRVQKPAAASAPPATAATEQPGLTIPLPPGADRAAVREGLEAARDLLQEAIDKQRELAEAERDAAEASREATEAAAAATEAGSGPRGKIKRTRHVQWGDFLVDLALVWVIGSAIVKATYKGRIQAEAKAAAATETAEAESLKRQVVEARMAAMQAQVEPHFLFNTLASIDHLIETDPPRASLMQKNLIALLRASMPTLRETGGNAGGVRDLGRELDVIRPYLAILKVRMEERLTTLIDVPDGLLSAAFPPMMMQTLVENAIKHGLEPKAEGGLLSVKAEVRHGKLAVSVADTGLGFGKAATAGTGVGLANVRERLQMLYGGKAALTITDNPGGGTVITITVPYRSVTQEEGASA